MQNFKHMVVIYQSKEEIILHVPVSYHIFNRIGNYLQFPIHEDLKNIIFFENHIKVGFLPSLTLMAIFFANVSLKYGYVCMILDFLPRSTKKEIFFLCTGRHVFFFNSKKD